MIKLQYTYRGAPITPYRPQGRKGPGKVATVVIVLLLVTGLLYGAWELYDSMGEEEEQNSNVYPLVRVRGVIPANSICKDAGVVVTKR